VIRISARIVFMSLVACASTPTFPAPSWDGCHCTQLDEISRKLAGPAMTDCGFFDLTEDSSHQRLHAGMRCARRAFGGTGAFRYGSVRIPIDSYATEVLVRALDGSLWLLTRDVMLDGDAPQLWVQRCDRLRFKPRNAGFVIEGCKSQMNLR
jgi:hypothetical protein